MKAGLPGYESLVFRDENVFAMPDIAPFVEGHYLIVSEVHLFSFGEANAIILNSHEKARKHLVNSNVLDTKRILTLEHGSTSKGSGVCIDHAHTHVLPVPNEVSVSIIDEFIVHRTGSKKVRVSRECIYNDIEEKKPYVYYELDGESCMYPIYALTSQFTRNLLAHVLGSTEYRWGEMYKHEKYQNYFRRSMSIEKLLFV